jgi:hypothetical protein
MFCYTLNNCGIVVGGDNLSTAQSYGNCLMLMIFAEDVHVCDVINGNVCQIQCSYLI